MLYLPNCGVVNTILSTQRSIGFAAFANGNNLFAGEFRAPMFFPYCHSVLLRCVSRVVGWSSNKKMGNIYTAAIVAAMADEHSFWNWPALLFIEIPVRWYSSARLAADLDTAVSATGKITGPFNAAIRHCAEILVFRFVCTLKSAKCLSSVSSRVTTSAKTSANRSCFAINAFFNHEAIVADMVGKR